MLKKFTFLKSSSKVVRNIHHPAKSDEILFKVGTPIIVIPKCNKHCFSFSQFQQANMVYVYQSDVSSLARNVKNDVAIIYLKKPYEFNDRIKPACLPKTQPVHGSTCYASGWGNMIRNQDGKAESPDNLMTAPLKILSKYVVFRQMAAKTFS